MDNYWKKDCSEMNGGKTCKNVCPAKMDDGRYLQDFRSATRRDQYNKYINGIVRDDDYRLYLQQNGELIMTPLFLCSCRVI